MDTTKYRIERTEHVDCWTPIILRKRDNIIHYWEYYGGPMIDMGDVGIHLNIMVGDKIVASTNDAIENVTGITENFIRFYCINNGAVESIHKNENEIIVDMFPHTYIPTRALESIKNNSIFKNKTKHGI